MGWAQQKQHKRWGWCGWRAAKTEPRHIVLHIISAPILSCRPARKAERSQSVGAADVGGHKGNVTPPPSYATMGRASLPPRPLIVSTCALPPVPHVIDEEPSYVESTLPLLPSLPTRERPPSARRLKNRFFPQDSTACLSWRNASDTAACFSSFNSIEWFPLNASAQDEPCNQSDLPPLSLWIGAGTKSGCHPQPCLRGVRCLQQPLWVWGRLWGRGEVRLVLKCSFSGRTLLSLRITFECGALNMGLLVLDWVLRFAAVWKGEAGSLPDTHCLPCCPWQLCRDSAHSLRAHNNTVTLHNILIGQSS